MDARVFLHLTDSIATATSAADIEVARDLVRAGAMHTIERRALERALQIRRDALRLGDAAVPRQTVAARGD
jgi:hypothetical protein